MWPVCRAWSGSTHTGCVYTGGTSPVHCGVLEATGPIVHPAKSTSCPQTSAGVAGQEGPWEVT